MCATDKPLFFKNCEQMSFHLDRAPKTEPEKWLDPRQVERSKLSTVTYNVTWDIGGTGVLGNSFQRYLCSSVDLTGESSSSCDCYCLCNPSSPLWQFWISVPHFSFVQHSEYVSSSVAWRTQLVKNNYAITRKACGS